MKFVYGVGHRIFRITTRALFNYRVIGKEKLVQDGGVLVASNHESYLDPPLVGIAYDDEVNYLARKTLFRGFAAWLYPRWNAIPVDQQRPDMTSLKKIIKLVKNGERVVVFPEGERTWDGEMLPAKAGLGLMVAKTKAMVQPVRIFGAHQALPRGKGWLKFHPITIVVGDPIVFDSELLSQKTREGYQQISDRIMNEIKALKI